MCRHLAWLGEPRSLHDLVLAPEHGLLTQTWAPRRQRHGTVNVDGFGLGWYSPVRPEPVRYRRAQPLWTDASLASLAPTVTSGCVLAAVRSATPGTAPDESAAAPFVEGTRLFSHNGRLEDWTGARAALRERTADTPEARVGVDSALLLGLAARTWADGGDLADGLAAAACAVLEHGGGRLTTLAADGTAVAGVVCGEPMWTRTTDAGVLVVSEPDGTDGPDWHEVPDRTVLRVSATGVSLSPL